MFCPPKITSLLLKIIESGILNIRYLINKKEYRLSEIEANHIHNLPGLIENFSQDLFEYYLDMEVTEYLREMGEHLSQDFKVNLNFLIEAK